MFARYQTVFQPVLSWPDADWLDDNRLGDLPARAAEAPAGSGGDDAPVTVKGVEAAVESAMRNAMGTLQSKTPSKPKPKAKPKPKEDAPTDPPKTRWDKLREAAWS